MIRIWAPRLMLAMLVLWLCSSSVWGRELEPGINAASVIDFPTALDQPVDHTLHASFDIFDFGEPDIRTDNLRYGYQWGNLQVVADFLFISDPEREFDHGVLRAKLRLLTLDDFLASLALGVLGRYTDSDEAEARIDEKTYSFLGVFTVELFPFDDWGGILLNTYLDNLIFSVGLKVQLLEQVKFITEVRYLHSTDIEDRTHSKTGIEIEGEQVFYFQLVYDDATERAVIQLGTGF